MGTKRCEYCGGVGFNAAYVNGKEIRSPCGMCNGSGRLRDDKPSVSTKESGVCFIATATYGSYSEPEVKVFRNYRDHVLKRSKVGNSFIQSYYLISPPIAWLLSKSRPLRSIVKKAMLDPLFRMLRDKYSS